MGQEQKAVAFIAVGFLSTVEERQAKYLGRYQNGQIRTLLWVKDSPVTPAYRILVANRTASAREPQWFDAVEIPNAIKSLEQSYKAYKKAKRRLEGGIVRRLLRVLF